MDKLNWFMKESYTLIRTDKKCINLNNDLKKLIDNKKLSIKDIPILVYCYNKTCDAGKTLIKRLQLANYHKIVEYDEGVSGFFK